MPDVNREALWRDMDRLAQRMGARLLEFKGRRESTQVRGHLTRLAERHRQLRNRFEAASSAEWNSAKDDLSRQQRDLSDEFVKFEEKLDRNERMRTPLDRVPGAKSGLV
ncbi:MAG: hypothetical protein GEU91_06560 [Rhizobiales bacterium]|nr:hypothetical protein [Hyphomicrobiales bacterium]